MLHQTSNISISPVCLQATAHEEKFGHLCRIKKGNFPSERCKHRQEWFFSGKLLCRYP